MLEKRWLLGLGPPVIVLGAVAVIAAPGSIANAAVHLLVPAADAPVAAAARPDPIPADVAARAWVAERGDGVWAYGRAGASSRRALPAGETAIAIGRRYLASTVALPSGTSRLILRDWSSGKIAARADAPMWISTGAFRADDLVVTGYGDVRAATDGGLAIYFARPAKWRVLLPAGRFPAGMAAASRGDVHVSPGGRLAASYFCQADACDTQVVDLESGARVYHHRHAAFLRALTDDALVLTDGEFEWISAVNVRSGHEVWRVHDSILMNPLAGADGSVTGLVGSNRPGWAVARIGPDGRSMDLTPRTWNGTWPQVWTQLSTPKTAVIGRGDLAQALSGQVSAAADIVDTAQARVLGRDVLLLPDH
jgi:hypothetical protein